MNATRIILALTLLAGVAATSFLTPTPSFAQSQPNYGPNSPGGGDTFGEPYSGTAAPAPQPSWLFDPFRGKSIFALQGRRQTLDPRGPGGLVRY